jgi:hypothetical protein
LKTNTDETAKKTKNVFYKCVLEFNFATIKDHRFFSRAEKPPEDGVYF